MSNTQLYYTLKWPKVSPPVVHGILRMHLAVLEGWLDECLWLTQHNFPEAFQQSQITIQTVSVEEKQNFLLSPSTFSSLSSAMRNMDADEHLKIVTEYAEDINRQRGNINGWTSLTDRHVINNQEVIETTVIADSIIIDFDSPKALRMDLTSSVFSETPQPVPLAVRQQIIEKLSQAMDLIDSVASTAGQLIRNATRCIRIRMSESGAISAETDPSTIGEVRLLNYHLAEKDIVDVADALIHESLHSFLAMYELQHGRFVSFNQTSLVRPVSPWSGNPIPYNAFTHAVYIYFALFEFYKLLYHSSALPNRKTNVAYRMSQCSRGFRVTDIPRLLSMIGQSPDEIMMQYQLMSEDVRTYYQTDQEAVC